MFKMVIIANALPNFNVDDPAVWARVRKVDFNTCFERLTPDSDLHNMATGEMAEKKRFFMDTSFDAKSMKRGMIWLMYFYHRQIKKRGHSPEPVQITEATAMYRVDNNPVDRFLCECAVSIRKRRLKDDAGNNTSTFDDGSFTSEDEITNLLESRDIILLDMADMFNSYKKWHLAQGITGKNKPALRDFESAVAKFYGPPDKVKKPEPFTGWKFVFIRVKYAHRVGDKPLFSDTFTTSIFQS